MIGHDFQCQYVTFEVGGRLPDQLHQAVTDRPDEDLPPPLRAEDDVVVHQEDAGFLATIGLTHDGIVGVSVLFVNLQQHGPHAFIPPLKGVGFRLIFCKFGRMVIDRDEFLGGHLSLDLLEGDRVEIPAVHAHVALRQVLLLC